MKKFSLTWSASMSMVLSSGLDYVNILVFSGWSFSSPVDSKGRRAYSREGRSKKVSNFSAAGKDTYNLSSQSWKYERVLKSFQLVKLLDK